MLFSEASNVTRRLGHNDAHLNIFSRALVGWNNPQWWRVMFSDESLLSAQSGCRKPVAEPFFHADIARPHGPISSKGLACHVVGFVMYRTRLWCAWECSFSASREKQYAARPSLVLARRLDQDPSADYPKTYLVVKEQSPWMPTQ